MINGVPSELKQILVLPKKFFSLIVGKRKLTAIYTPDYHREVIKDFWTDVMNNELQNEKDYIGEEFWKYVYMPYESRLYEAIHC